MRDKLNIKWLDEPEEHIYPAAASYLSLIYPEATASDLSVKLKTAKVASFKSKDIFRASGISLLGISNSHVEKVREKSSRCHSIVAASSCKRHAEWKSSYC